MSYTFDQADQLISQTDGDGNVTTFIRNAAGQVTIRNCATTAAS